MSLLSSLGFEPIDAEDIAGAKDATKIASFKNEYGEEYDVFFGYHKECKSVYYISGSETDNKPVVIVATQKCISWGEKEFGDFILNLVERRKIAGIISRHESAI
jgi:hypothetical protein